MPAAPVALLLAALLAAAVTAATPAVLRQLPVPPDEVDVAPFAELDSPAFRFAVFACSAVAGAIAFVSLPAKQWPAWVGLVSLGMMLGLVDLRTGFLPLRLSHWATALGAAGVLVSGWLRADWTPVVHAAAAGIAAAGFFWVVWRFTAGFGFGDVRLAGLVGMVAGSGGLQLAAWSMLLGTGVGACVGVGLRIRRRTDGPFPYGPALLAGPLLALLLSRLLPPG